MTTVTIPDDEGVEYQVNGAPVTGTIEAEGEVVVKAIPKKGYKFTEGSVTEWTFGSPEDYDVPLSSENTDTFG